MGRRQTAAAAPSASVLSTDFGRYVEPFFGSGAVFFDLHSAGRLLDRDVVLIDSNTDLVGCYETVRDAPEEVVRALDRLAAGHARDGHAHYYAVRDRFFNPLRARRRGEGAPSPTRPSWRRCSST